MACATAGVALAVQARSGVTLPGDMLLRFTFLFLLGSLGLLYAGRIPITRAAAAGAATLFAASLALGGDDRPIGGAAFAYLCLLAVVATPWLRRRPPADVSYGVYTWHWPVSTVLVLLGAGAWGRAAYTVTVLLLTVLVASLSWYAVEKPALRRKDAPWPPTRLGPSTRGSDR